MNDRPIRTAIGKLNREGVVESEICGKHEKQAKISVATLAGLKKH